MPMLSDPRLQLVAAALASRRALVLQLAFAASFLGCALTEVALVKAGTACEVYLRGEDARGIWAVSSLAGAATLLALRLGAQAVQRRWRSLLGSLALLVGEGALAFGALALVVDVGLFYCAFQDVQLSPCLFGCAR